MLDRWQEEGMEAQKQCISSGQQRAGAKTGTTAAAGADGGEDGRRQGRTAARADGGQGGETEAAGSLIN